MTFRTIADLDVRGKRVLLREDLNVPLRDGRVADETRIVAALPTIRALRERGARVLILSHLGRPSGPDPALSLRPIAGVLSERLGIPVAFAEDCIGDAARAIAERLRDGEVALLENVRFHAGEERNDPAFAQALAELGDCYVNDAFGTAHRAHASTEGIARLLPSAAGLLMQAELAALSRLLDCPERPFVCVIGGAKVKDKVGVFVNLLARVQAFCIGGGMANTFLAAQGVNVGRSLRDDDLEPARRILQLARDHGVVLHLPDDAVVSATFDDDAGAHTAEITAIGDTMILDIGPRTARRYAEVIEEARTIVFNGPMGVYERAPYREGTRIVGEAIARATERGAFSVVGGGDAAAAAQMLGFADRVTHLSTGGGATLEYLEGKMLPGVAALSVPAAPEGAA
jgi:phosphoglycerate kinase